MSTQGWEKTKRRGVYEKSGRYRIRTKVQNHEGETVQRQKTLPKGATMREAIARRQEMVAEIKRPPDEPNIFVHQPATQTWIHHALGPNRPVWRDEAGQILEYEYTGERSAECVTVVLTIAHTCQDPRCDALDHLEALCQRCHLQLDRQPAERARRDRIKSEIRGQQSLFGGSGCR